MHGVSQKVSICEDKFLTMQYDILLFSHFTQTVLYYFQR